MLCVSLSNYTRACGGVTGGISDIAIFDPFDLDFTQVAPVNGKSQSYSAVTERAGVDGNSVFIIQFQADEAEWTWSQSVTGCAVQYEHSFGFQLPENSQVLTAFQEALDAAGCCCGIGLIFRTNSGKIFVAGERYVNGDSIPRFTIKQNGSEGGTGRAFVDFNGGNLQLQGNYSRNLYQYSGTWASIEALAGVEGS